MQKLTSALKYQHYARVTGHDVRGLLDCMRYDRACLFEEADAIIVAGAHHHPLNDFTILITKFSESSREPWTLNKWYSYHLELEPIVDGREHNFERVHPKKSLV